MNHSSVVIACVFALLLAASPVTAAVITVNTTTDELTTNGNCSLREAIRSANLNAAVDACTAGSGADEIVVPAGTYTLTLGPAGDDAALSGDLDITGTLTITGAGAGVTIIEGCAIVPPATSCTGIDRVFDIRPGAIVTITGVTIRHGTTILAGGGILVDGGVSGGATLTVIDSVISDNVAGDGGGLRTGGLVATLTRTTVARNRTTASAGGGGGGIVNFTGTLNLLDSAVIDNQAAGGSGSFGGGIYNLATVVITDSTIAGNTTLVHGGGIANLGPMTMTGSTISHNSAAIGGGIRNFSPLTITNSTLSGNTGTQGGGGLSNGSNTSTLINVTLTDNRTPFQGGGILVESGTVNLRNTLVAGNLDTNPISNGNSPDCMGALTSQGFNIIGTVGTFGTVPACTGVVNGVNGDQVGTDASPIDPQITPLADHGGPTLTHGLVIGSPAINAGNPSGCLNSAGAPLTADQRGFARPVGPICDIGAFEGVVQQPLGHFLCYKAKTAQGTLKFPGVVGLDLVDQFESGDFDVRKTSHLCTPTNKNSEGVPDPDTHLKAYTMRLTKTEPPQPKHVPQLGLQVDNQFGLLSVDTKKVLRLLVPAAKSLTGPVTAPDPDGHSVDHYKCYKIKVSRGTPKFTKRTVTVADQFTTGKSFEVKKPLELCVAVDKAHEGVKNDAAHLMCYRGKALLPKHVPVLADVADQFGAERLQTKKEQNLCLPSTLSAPVALTSGVSLTTADEEEDDPDDDLDDEDLEDLEDEAEED